MRFLLNLTIVLGSLMCSLSSGLAEEKNGVRLSVQKTTLDRNRERNEFSNWDRVDKALALKAEIKNTGFSPREPGEIKFGVIVKKWGTTPVIYELYEGTVKLPALKPAEDTKITMGKVPLSGWESSRNRKDYVDSIEAWQVVVLHSGTESVRATSSSAYEKLSERATPKKVSAHKSE